MVWWRADTSKAGKGESGGCHKVAKSLLGPLHGPSFELATTTDPLRVHHTPDRSIPYLCCASLRAGSCYHCIRDGDQIHSDQKGFGKVLTTG